MPISETFDPPWVMIRARLWRPPLRFALAALILTACGPREARQGAVRAPLPPLPVAVEATWTAVRLDARSHALPDRAPSVVISAPEGTVRRSTPVVIYLHGWEGCAAAVAGTGPTACVPGESPRPGWGIAQLHEAAGTGSVLVVPQLAYDIQSSSAGAFSDPAFAAAWWAELQDRMETELGLRSTGQVILVAHSGGYRTLQELLEADFDSGVDTAVFLDGLYGGADEVASWVIEVPGRRAISLHTDNATTTSQSRTLAARVSQALGDEAVAVDPSDIDRALSEQQVVVAYTDASHGAVPAAWLERLLSALVR